MILTSLSATVVVNSWSTSSALQQSNPGRAAVFNLGVNLITRQTPYRLARSCQRVDGDGVKRCRGHVGTLISKLHEQLGKPT